MNLRLASALASAIAVAVAPVDGFNHSPATPTPTPTQSSAQCGAALKDVLFVGYDLTFVIKSSLTAAACCQACTETRGCAAYSLVEALGIKTCFLKSAVGLQIPKPFGLTATSGLVAATPAPTPAPTTVKPTPAPTTTKPYPTPAPTTAKPPTEAPTTAPTTQAPTPAPTTPTPTTEAPTPAPTTEAPTPSPTPAPTTEAPTPAPTTEAPTPSPTPTPTTEAPTPEPTTATPTPTTATPTPTTSAPLVCGTQLKNIYYHGFDLATSTLQTAAECCAACAAYSGCKLYTHFISSTTGQHTCYLKSAAGEKTNYADSSSVTAVSAFMVAGTAAPTTAPTPTPTSTTAPTPTSTTASPTETPTPTPTPAPTCGTPIENVMYNDYTMYEFELETADECCEYCSEFDGCLLYSFYAQPSSSTFRCLLKNGEGNTTSYTPQDGLTVQSAFLTNPVTPAPTSAPTCAAQGEYCGNAWGTSCCASGSYCQPWNDYYYQCIGLPDTCGDMETDVDYYGADVGSVQTLYPWTCCDLCQQTEGCEFYTFWNLDPNGPTCYMKSSKAGKVASSGRLSGARFNSTVGSRE